MAIKLPGETTFADVEEVICNFVDNLLEDAEPRPYVGTWIPDGSANDLQNAQSIVIVQRHGGATDYRQRASVDEANIALSVLSATRRDAWAIVSYLRQKFYELSGGGNVGEWRITYIRESDGPNEIPYAEPTMRMVRFYFMFGIRRNVR